jgi:acyl-CoA reductase-like NAD-dependent aldehyde dehydrogenase
VRGARAVPGKTLTERWYNKNRRNELKERALTLPNGLSAGIITKDFTRALALRLAMRLETGMVPIGGGYGRFGGQAALDEFTELRWIR